MVNIATFMLVIALKGVTLCSILLNHQRLWLIQMMEMNKERSSQSHKVKNQRLKRKLQKMEKSQKKKRMSDEENKINRIFEVIITNTLMIQK